MAGKKKIPGADERLDEMGREVVRASAANEREAEGAAASPFLYTRISARISAERARREERESWFTLLAVVWRAVPAMALVAIFAFALFLTASLRTPATGGFSDEALFGASDNGVERVVFADNQPLSSDDDVLATILGADDEREGSR